MNAFITGASSGLGEAIATELVRRYPQCSIGLTARRLDRLQIVADALKAESATRGGSCNCEIYPLDIADTDALASAGKHFVDVAGVPDMVIANAGISAGTQAGSSDDGEVFRRILQVNVAGVQATLDSFVPAMRAAGRGTLVGIGSVAGIRGLPGAGAYSASKAAVHAYLESLRVELHHSGVRVVTIAPGYIRTPMTERNKYPMPFLMPAERFAIKAVDAMVAGRRRAVIPWQMSWVARALAVTPDFLFDRLFARAPRKQRQDPGSL